MVWFKGYLTMRVEAMFNPDRKRVAAIGSDHAKQVDIIRL